MTCPSREWYEATRTHLYSVGLPMRSAVDAEPQWREFLSLRGQYEDALFFVARQTFAPLEGVLVDMVERLRREL